MSDDEDRRGSGQDPHGVDVAQDAEATRDSSDPVVTSRAMVPPPVQRDYEAFTEVDRHHYVFEHEIARGGMGRVYAARDLRLGRPVAIKELLPRKRDAVRRFEVEARITAGLQHPSIIHVYEAGVWPGGEPFFAMKRVDGDSLEHVVVKRTTLSARLGLLPNVIAVAQALAYAHSKDVIHRDLKPSNVLVGEFGETVVIDWGLAKDMAGGGDAAASGGLERARSEGSIEGTPAYMPPEQARGEPVDQRADVYSIGAMLYRVLVGAPPYRGTSDDVVQAVIAGAPVDVAAREPAAPPDLVAIVSRAMARDPGARYASAAELAADLERFETGRLVSARKYTPLQLVGRFVRRHLVAALSTLAVVALASWFYVQNVKEKNTATEQREAAERGRTALLAERGRTELIDGEYGRALVYLLGALEASREVRPHGALAFQIAEALHRFETPRIVLAAGTGDVRVAYRPEGTELATASADGVVSIWDPRGHRRTAFRSPAGVRAIAWSPDRPILALACEDGVLRLWSVDDDVVRELRGHRGAIEAIDFSSQGRWLATGSRDGTVRVWEHASGVSLPLPVDHRAAVTSVAFRPDGTAIASASSDGEAHAWFTRAGKQEEKTWPLRKHTEAIHALRWSPDGKSLLTASADGTAVVWDPTKGKEVMQTIRHGSGVAIRDAAFSEDGARVVTGGDDRAAREWTLPPHDRPFFGAYLEHELPHNDPVVIVQYYRDEWIATAGDDRVVKVWSTSRRLVAQLEHTAAITSLAFSSAGKTLVIGGHDGTALIWDFQAGALREGSHDLASPIRALATTSDGYVVAATEDSKLTTWREPSESVVQDKHVGLALCAAVSPNGELVASGGEGRALLWRTRPREGWSIDEGRKLTLIDDAAVKVTAIAFSPDSATVATGDATGTVTWWDAHTGARIASARPLRGPIRGLAFAPADELVAAATELGIVLWDRRGHELGRFAQEAVESLAFSPAGDRLVTGGPRGTVILRVIERELETDVLLTGAGPVEAIAITDGGLVATGGSEGIVRVWDLETGRLLATRNASNGPIHALAFARAQSLLWIGTEGGLAQPSALAASRDPVYVLAYKKGLVRWKLDDGDVAAEKRHGEW